MQHDLPTPADAACKLSLQNVAIGDARERLIRFLTDHWFQSLSTLAEKLKGQGFGPVETLELCETFRPKFEENLTNAISELDDFVAQCSGETKHG